MVRGVRHNGRGANADRNTPIVQLDPLYSPGLWGITECNSFETTSPCFIDGDVSLLIAERVFLGQTYYFSRIRYWQHPDADNDSTKLIQVDMNNATNAPSCESTDTFTNVVRGYLDVRYSEFTEHTYPSAGNADECFLRADPICYSYWFE